jgi:starch phosphorylase
VTYSLADTPAGLDETEAFRAIALAARDRLVERCHATLERYRAADAKRLYYLSMEFLIGRSLVNNLLNLGLLDAAREALKALGFDLNLIEQRESDAALGNGGLGRLAACFLDSLATLGMPGFGYGINYEYGLFRQEIRNGEQIEKPDSWRVYNTPWLVEKPQEAVIVPMYGRVEHSRDRKGGYNPMWLDWKVVLGVPHDMMIAGYGGKAVNVLRLFSARASTEMDIAIFNLGDYLSAVER